MSAARPPVNVSKPSHRPSNSSTLVMSPIASTAVSANFATGNISQDEKDKALERRFESVAVQFSSLVLLSTFAATLIISFLSLAHDILQNPTSLQFQIGMFLCFIAAGTHLSLVLVAGRAATLAFRRAKPHPLERRSIEEDEREFNEFWKCRELCEQMQIVGTTIFVPALLFTVWFMFPSKTFTILLYAVACVGGIWVYIAGFWKISVIGSTVTRVTAARNSHPPPNQIGQETV